MKDGNSFVVYVYHVFLLFIIFKRVLPYLGKKYPPFAIEFSLLPILLD